MAQLIGTGISIHSVNRQEQWHEQNKKWHDEEFDFREEQRKWREADVRHRGIEKRWRSEDMQARRLDIMQRALTNKGDLLLLKTNNLSAMASISALMAGLTMVMYVELEIPEECPDWLRMIHGVLSSFVVCLFSVVLLQCTLLMAVAANQSQRLSDKLRFAHFWESRLHKEWSRSLYIFLYIGFPSFIVAVAVSGIVKNLTAIDPGWTIGISVGMSIFPLFTIYRGCRNTSRFGDILTKAVTNEFDPDRSDDGIFTKVGVPLTVRGTTRTGLP